MLAFCLLGLNRRLQTSSGMSATSANPPQLLQRAASRGPGRRCSPRLPGGCGPDRRVAAGLQKHPAILPCTSGQRKVPEGGRCTTSAHTLPTKTIRAQAMAAKFLRPIWWIEEENSQRPPSGNAPCQGTFVFISFCCQ